MLYGYRARCSMIFQSHFGYNGRRRIALRQSVAQNLGQTLGVNPTVTSQVLTNVLLTLVTTRVLVIYL